MFVRTAIQQENLQESGAPLQPSTGHIADQDWVKMLTSSPLFKAVNDIEELIKDGVAPQGCVGAKGRPYIDIKVCDSYAWLHSKFLNV